MEISLCLIVKNEADVIERCINSVKDAIDEIIVVDTGSEDTTIEKAEKCGAKVFFLRWEDDFAKARNYAFSKATKEYILWLDADDVVLKKDLDEIKKLKKLLAKDIDAVNMKYVLSVDENRNPQTFIRRNRIVKRQRMFKWIGNVHEYLEVYGKIMVTDINIIHLKNKEYTDRNLLIYEKMLSKGVAFSPRERLYYANELKDNKIYTYAIKNYQRFLNEGKGIAEDNKLACIRIAECYKQLNNYEEANGYMLKTLQYGIPTAEICCKIGEMLIEKENIKAAIYWYENALNNKADENIYELVNECYSTWVPLLQLCFCYGKIFEYEKAAYFNEEAAKFIPNNKNILYNRKFFESRNIKVMDNGQ